MRPPIPTAVDCGNRLQFRGFGPTSASLSPRRRSRDTLCHPSYSDQHRAGWILTGQDVFISILVLIFLPLTLFPAVKEFALLLL